MWDQNYEKHQTKLFFDIETIPVGENMREVAVSLLAQKDTNLKKSKKLNKKQKDFYHRLTAISGDFGRIFCIGYAMNDKDVEIIKGEEAKILTDWWSVANGADLFIGHNIMEFDLRFIFKRSIANKIKPSAKHLNLSFARYRNYPIFDTMREWEKWSNSFIKLDTLAKILGLESSKDETIDGSKVYDFYSAGKYDEIYKYCTRDVELTRRVYRRMSFEA